MTARLEPSRQLLQEVLQDAGCPLDLDTAMQDPTLRILLVNGAEARMRQRYSTTTPALRRLAGTYDWRARAAGDN